MVIKKKTAVKAKTGCKRKMVRRDRFFEFKQPKKQCPTCTSSVELINLHYKSQPKSKVDIEGALGEVMRNPKTYCPKCGGIPKRQIVRKDSVGRMNKLRVPAKFVHEIEAKDIGKGFVPCDKCEAGRKAKVINMRDLMGRAQRKDIGKRIYRVGGIYQVENDEQLAKRKKQRSR